MTAETLPVKDEMLNVNEVYPTSQHIGKTEHRHAWLRSSELVSEREATGAHPG